jgi:hypothetical protein
MRRFRALGRLDDLPQEDALSHAMSLAQLDEQYVELLPARVVLSMFSVEGAGGSSSGDGSYGVGKFGMKVFGLAIPPGGGNGTGMPGISQNG